MHSFDELKRPGLVGREREVPPVGEQFGLGSDEPGAAHDQPPVPELGLGDLRLAGLGIVRDLDPRVLADQVDQRSDRLALLDADRELDGAGSQSFEQILGVLTRVVAMRTQPPL